MSLVTNVILQVSVSEDQEELLAFLNAEFFNEYGGLRDLSEAHDGWGGNKHNGLRRSALFTY